MLIWVQLKLILQSASASGRSESNQRELRNSIILSFGFVTALRDDHSYYNNEKKQSSMLKPSYESHSIIDGHLTPLEIGIYILVAVLCAAIAVLMASCFVSASKYRRQMYPVSLTASLSQHILQERNKKPIQNANDWVWLGGTGSKSSLEKSTSESVRSSCHSGSAEVHVITNPQDNLQEPERIPLNQLNTNYPRQQYRPVLPDTYENGRPSRRMQLPKIPGKKRRLLPQVNTATYTKKIADLNNRASPPGILPVGYPVFLPEEDLSPYLPDPSSMDSLRAPLRQSPASALPPVLVEAARACETVEVPEAKPEAENIIHEKYEYLNPDIHRPSPPRAGAPRLFENPFELTDEDSAPVEPQELSPSHVFESTSLEDSLLLLEAKAATPMSEKRPLDTRTFVIRRSSRSPSEIKAVTPEQESVSDTEIPLGAEAADEESNVEHDMDYDNLMAYFENLKESNA